jgi:DNA-binding NarL/FixJ family response regulator
MINIVAIDDDRMLLDGLANWIATAPDLRLTATAANVDELLSAAPVPIDVVLLDLVLQDHSAPEDNVRRLVALGCRVLVVSVWSELDQVVATFAAGSSGYLTKDQDLAALGTAIRTVAAGGTVFSPELAFACLRVSRRARPALSPREREVLVAYASGMTLKSVATHVGIRPETARTYLERVKAKYQDVGRPTATKLDLAERVREDQLGFGALRPA